MQGPFEFLEGSLGCFQGSWEVPGGVLGRSRGSVEDPWGVLGIPWRIPGGSLGNPGGPWRVLEGSLGDPGNPWMVPWDARRSLEDPWWVTRGEAAPSSVSNEVKSECMKRCDTAIGKPASAHRCTVLLGIEVEGMPAEIHRLLTLGKHCNQRSTYAKRHSPEKAIGLNRFDEVHLRKVTALAGGALPGFFPLCTLA